jgi:hypothetical protein
MTSRTMHATWELHIVSYDVTYTSDLTCFERYRQLQRPDVASLFQQSDEPAWEPNGVHSRPGKPTAAPRCRRELGRQMGGSSRPSTSGSRSTPATKCGRPATRPTRTPALLGYRLIRRPTAPSTVKTSCSGTRSA